MSASILDLGDSIRDFKLTLGLMRHLACSPLSIEGDDVAVILDKLDLINSVMQAEYENARKEWEEEEAALKEQLEEAKAKRAEPGSVADRKNVESLWRLARSLSEVIASECTAAEQARTEAAA